MHERRTLSALSLEISHGKRLPKRQKELSEGNTNHREDPKTPYSQSKALTNSTYSNAPSEPDDPFEPSDPSLLVTDARIAVIRARILIDEAAEFNLQRIL